MKTHKNHKQAMLGRTVLATAVWLALMGQSALAAAQQQPAQPQASATPRPQDGQEAERSAPVQLDRVVVTAQKREELLQDVPIAVSEVSGDRLEQLHIDNNDQLKYLVPSFNSDSFGVSIRGVGTSTFSNSIELSVSTVLDGVPLGRPEMAIGAYYDLARVEVLRGPQGMLFGKNASAGVVSLVTQEAKLGKFEALANVNVGNLGYQDANATLNLPLGDTLALRFGGYLNRYDGLVTNKPDGRKFDGQDETGARLRLLWAPTSALTVRLGLDHAKRDAAPIWVAYKLNPTGSLGLALKACGITASNDNRQTCLDGPVGRNFKNDGVFASADYSFENGNTLTWIGGYRKNTTFNDWDSDMLPVNILNINNNYQDIKQHSHELRLASPGDNRFRYTLGLYYFVLDSFQRTDQRGTFGIAPLPVLDLLINSQVESRSQAAFGQIEYDFSERFTGIAGARYTRDRISMNFSQGVTPGFVQIRPIVNRFDETRENNVSWRFGAKWKLTDGVMLYATASRGYKSPGFNQTGIANATTSQLVGPEIPTNYELGLRSTHFGGALVANVTAFQEKFKGYQAQVLDTTLTPAVFRTINAGNLSSKGLEADVSAVLPVGIVLTAAVAYLDAKYQDYGLVSCYPGQIDRCVTVAPGVRLTNPSGQFLAGAARWRSTFSAYHQWHLTGGLDGFLQTDFNYRSKVNLSVNGDPNTVIKGYGLLNASLGVVSRDGRWRVSLWGRNLLDKRYQAAIFGAPVGASPLGGDYVQIPDLDQQRRYGIGINFRF